MTSKVPDLHEYNQYFIDDTDDEENELPCSQMQHYNKKPMSDSQVLANMSLNLMDNSITSKIIEQKAQNNKYSAYRDTQYSHQSTNDNSNSSSSNSSSYKSPRSPYTQTQDNTQMKRAKFLDDIMDSTNNEPVKQVC